MTKSYTCLIEPLMSYSSEVFREMTPDKYARVRLTYEIMREAIADLHGGNEEHKKTAENYFNGELFQHHCECVGISDVTMMYIVNNPHLYLAKMNYSNNIMSADYESHSQL